MKRILSLLLTAAFVLLLLAMPTCAEEARIIKIACVGDSITGGTATADTAAASYPIQLGLLLDNTRYQVENFGLGGSGAMKNKGSITYSYWSEHQYTDSIAYEPDVVIIMFGTNDAVNDQYDEETFRFDLAAMVEAYQALPTHPRIILATPCTPFDSGHGRVNSSVVPVVRSIANEKNLTLVDINTLTEGKRDMFADDIHPNAQGYLMLAQEFYTVAFDGVLSELTVKTEAGNKVIYGVQNVTADENGYASIVTGNGGKKIEIQKTDGSFAFANVTVTGDSVADCTSLIFTKNIALAATPFDHAGKDASNINDGDASTGWQADNDAAYSNIWAALDFGTLMEFDCVEIEWEADTRAKQGKYRVQYSADNVTWTDVENATYDYTINHDKVTFASITAQYVRVKIEEGMHNKFRPSLREMRVYSATDIAEITPTVTINDNSTSEATSIEDASATGGISPIAPIAICIVCATVVAVVIILLLKKKKK